MAMQTIPEININFTNHIKTGVMLPEIRAVLETVCKLEGEQPHLECVENVLSVTGDLDPLLYKIFLEQI